eukprot:TRINITY_DN1191_c0_g1_i1.p1 TRINITY_DN1191_c0_g1~~TRINITY_DN1191_c0_g1_i1.p1  ORF type:complete len:811 (-),score=128.79 TRINITY_DN1191_c0_g1_i1:99-2531(-)
MTAMQSSKLTSISVPRKAKRGIFAFEAAGFLDDELSETKPSIAWTTSSWGSGSHMESTVALIPRTPDSTRMAASIELAPLGWAIDSRPSTRGASSRPSTRGASRASMRSQQEADKKRHLAEAKELAEARRALRGITPGDWDAKLFAQYYKQFTADGRWSALNGLAAITWKTSEEALKAGGYRVSSYRGMEVHIPQHPLVYWLGAEGVTDPEPYTGVPPPLIVSHETPLEAARKLSKCFRQHPLILVMEALDFSSQRVGSGGNTAGRLLEASKSKSVNQHEIFLCSNLQYASRSAANLCGETSSPMQKLNARHNPQIFAAEDVVCFRGCASDGYPFLSEDELVWMTVLVTGRALKRPWFAERSKAEKFKEKEDFICFMDRLNLWTYKALSFSSGLPPLLVISATDLLEAEYRQPRDAIAQALMTWRSMWAGHFQAVVVACGEASTAALIDRHVNTDIYCKVLRAQPISPSVTEWHWNSALVALSTNQVFSRIAARMDWEKTTTGARVSSTGRRPSGANNGRRHSGVGMLMMSEAMSRHQHGAGAILMQQEPTSPAGQSTFNSSPSQQTLTEIDSMRERRPSVQSGRRPSVQNGRRPSVQSSRRPSIGLGIDGQPETAREHAERLAKDRLATVQQHLKLDPLTNGQHSAGQAKLGDKAANSTTLENPSADVKLAVTTAAAAFKEFVGQKTKEPEPPKEIMTLEIKRQIDMYAEMMDMPSHLKRHCYHAIEGQLTGESDGNHGGAGQSSNKDREFDQASDSSEANKGGLDIVYAARIFQEVSDAAGSLSAVINRKRAEASSGTKPKLPPLTAR